MKAKNAFLASSDKRGTRPLRPNDTANINKKMKIKGKRRKKCKKNSKGKLKGKLKGDVPHPCPSPQGRGVYYASFGCVAGKDACVPRVAVGGSAFLPNTIIRHS
ncbi:MAG: hypothetical protein IKH26_02895 [Bacteroidaceae bacterium]|nr:hypothetical protein [Bacteroidaceae bacterium]